MAAVDHEFVVVSYSSDLGQHFSVPVRVNHVPQKILADGDNRPKVVALANGDLFVSYTEGLKTPYSGNIRFSRSIDGGRSFSTPLVVNDDRQEISHRFETFKIDNKGRIHIVWLDRRDWQSAHDAGRDYSGISMYYAHSDDGGKTFSRNEMLAAHTCECCRVAMDLDGDGTPVMLWRHVFDGGIRDHALMRLDAKREIQRVSQDEWQIDACPHHGGALTIDSSGTYHAIWFSGGGKHIGIAYAQSHDQGKRWSTPHYFGNPSRQAGHPFLLAQGLRLFVTWKEFDGQNSYAMMSTSEDGGMTFSAEYVLANVPGASDHPLLISNNKDVYLSWNTATKGILIVKAQR